MYINNTTLYLVGYNSDGFWCRRETEVEDYAIKSFKSFKEQDPHKDWVIIAKTVVHTPKKIVDDSLVDA